VGGFMGVPEALGGTHWLNGFLSTVFAPSNGMVGGHHLDHATEYALMGAIVALTLVMIGIAYIRYVRNNRVPATAEENMGALQRILYNKYYVDEIYHAIIVKPLYYIGASFDKVIERLGIDRLVNTVGNSVVWSSRAARLLQNGSIGYYIFIMVIGVVLILVANKLV
jgi:NADH-quinone oxidoreductase subunit L